MTAKGAWHHRDGCRLMVRAKHPRFAQTDEGISCLECRHKYLGEATAHTAGAARKRAARMAYEQQKCWLLSDPDYVQPTSCYAGRPGVWTLTMFARREGARLGHIRPPWSPPPTTDHHSIIITKPKDRGAA